MRLQEGDSVEVLQPDGGNWLQAKVMWMGSTQFTVDLNDGKCHRFVNYKGGDIQWRYCREG